MKNLSRNTGWILRAAVLLIMLGVAGVCWGASPQAAAGVDHTVFLHADGTLWAAGSNASGQLGDGSFTGHSEAVQIGSAADWQAVSAGSDHSLALKADGTLWAWGSNASGQLGSVSGVNPVANQNAPLKIGTERTWIAVAAGGASSYALKADGSLWAWGANASGQLGNGNTSRQNVPVPVQNPGSSRYRALSSGSDHVLALQADGSLWAWGANGSGQLGQLAVAGSALLVDNAPHPVPVQVLLAATPTDNDWSALAAGGAHSLALKSDGSLWAWGDNASGQIGVGSASGPVAPARIASGHVWAALAAGSLHSLALTRGGSLFAWGDNTSGQLGFGNAASQNSPLEITAPDGVDNLIGISAGAFHSLALKANGGFVAFGANVSGQFGNASFTGSLVPALVGSAGLGWVESEPGNQFTVARRSNGTLWSWGDNTNGQLGLGNLTVQLNPVLVDTRDNWGAQAAGFSHVAALKADGTLWSWGDNSSGQLGDGSQTPSLFPKQISGTDPSSLPNDWAALAAGDLHTLALKGDGTLWSWGDNSSGQLGYDTSVAPSPDLLPGTLPRQVTVVGSANNNWVAIAAGGSHSLGLQSDGTLWVWGDNSQGQLGDPSLVESSILPSQIVNFLPPVAGFNSSWKAISAGFGHSLALQADGTLWSWGSNFDGQLGDGSTLTVQPLPVPVANDGAPYVALAAGDAHSLARRADGTLWAWGRNLDGQLGIGLTDSVQTAHPTPLQVGLDRDWAHFGVGGSHGIALKAQGTLWAFGSNQNGQLGDGSTLDKNSPSALLEASLLVAPSLDFGARGAGGAAVTLPLTVSNAGNNLLVFSVPSPGGANGNQFSVSAGTCTGFTVAGKQSCQLSVVFTPVASAGPKSAILTLNSNDPVRPVSSVNLSASVVQQFNIITSVTPAGAGSLSPATLQVAPGATPSFTIAAAVGFHVTSVTVNGVPKGALTSLTLAPVNSDQLIAASFALDSHVITLAAGANGSLSGPTAALQTSTPTYSITPATGFHVLDVTVNGVSKGALTTLTLPPISADLTIAASFAINVYHITLSPGLHGGISGPATANFGTTPSYTITPAPGWFISAVSVNGAPRAVTPAGMAVTLPALASDVTVTASFDITTFTLSVTGDPRGSISIAPGGSALIPFGSSQTYILTPSAGYQVVKVLADGVDQGPLPASTFTFNNVTASGHTLKVSFTPDGDLDGNGVVDVADALRALKIAVQLVTATAQDKRHGDVAPFDGAGVPVPDNDIGVGDALGILRKVVGLSSGF